jgi:hypothetical protein
VWYLKSITRWNVVHRKYKTVRLQAARNNPSCLARRHISGGKE